MPLILPMGAGIGSGSGLASGSASGPPSLPVPLASLDFIAGVYMANGAAVDLDGILYEDSYNVGGFDPSTAIDADGLGFGNGDVPAVTPAIVTAMLAGPWTVMLERKGVMAGQPFCCGISFVDAANYATRNSLWFGSWTGNDLDHIAFHDDTPPMDGGEHEIVTALEFSTSEQAVTRYAGVFSYPAVSLHMLGQTPVTLTPVRNTVPDLAYLQGSNAWGRLTRMDLYAVALSPEQVQLALVTA